MITLLLPFFLLLVLRDLFDFIRRPSRVCAQRQITFHTAQLESEHGTGACFTSCLPPTKHPHNAHMQALHTFLEKKPALFTDVECFQIRSRMCVGTGHLHQQHLGG